MEKTPSTLAAMMRVRPADQKLDLHVHLQRSIAPDQTNQAMTELKSLSAEPERMEVLPGSIVFVPTTVGCIEQIAGLSQVEWLSMPAKPATLDDLLD